MRFSYSLVTVFVSCALVGCSLGSKPTLVDVTGSGSSLSSSFEPTPTPNVSYSGRIEELGITSYQQGTHRLSLEDGSFILLESTDANLNLDSYLGKMVEAHGSALPSIEPGTSLLRVQELIVLDDVSAITKQVCGGIAAQVCDDGYECVDDLSDSCDPINGGADCSGVCVKSTSIMKDTVLTESSSSVTESLSSSLSVSSSTSSETFSTSIFSSSVSSSQSSSSLRSTSSVSFVSSLSSSVSSTSSAPALTILSPEKSQELATMSKQKYGDSLLWSQSYCTSHIAFCVPAHKNWYFKSFGATTNNKWHIEFGVKPIENLGDGLIVMNLVVGNSASAGLQSGEVKQVGSDLVAAKDWKDDHFEIVGDATLREAILFMMSHITTYVPGQ